MCKLWHVGRLRVKLKRVSFISKMVFVNVTLKKFRKTDKVRSLFYTVTLQIFPQQKQQIEFFEIRNTSTR